MFQGRTALFIFLAVTGITTPVLSQDTRIPIIPSAEQAFDRGIASYEGGEYGQAHELFMEVVTGYIFNSRTTAALLMAGKALVAQGFYERAVDLMRRFVEDYPESRYFSEAQRTRDMALSQIERRERLRTAIFNLGVILPIDRQEAGFSQALFHGIRLAVDEHNARNPTVPVRMVFRDSGQNPADVRGAMNALVSDGGVHAVIGPLLSEEAVVAAEIAEEVGIPLIAPLATDDEVVRGKQFVFLANPSWSMRARLVARLAVENLRMRTLAVVGQQGTFSETMARAFREEAQRLGAEVSFFTLLTGSRGWSQLGQHIPSDTLIGTDGIYLPITGMDAPISIQGALNSLRLMGTNIRVLGNAEWHGLQIAGQASVYRTVYSSDFWVNESQAATRNFIQRYRNLAGSEPDRIGFSGYDVTRFLFSRMENRREGESLVLAIRAAGEYQGLGGRIDFSDGPVNKGIYFIEYRASGPHLLR